MISRSFPILAVVLALAGASPSLEFSGTLVSSNNTPPVNELVVLVEHHENRHADDPDSFAVRVQPGKDGAFAVQVPPDENGYMLFITDASNRMYKGFAHLGENTNFGAIAVQSGGVLAGSVQDRDHKPLPDIEVVLELRLLPHTCSHYVAAARCRTGAKGDFSFAGLSPGEYRYRPHSDTWAAQDGTVSITEDPAFLSLILDKAAFIKGKITDAAGQPVPDIRIRIDDQSALSDANGNYRLAGLASGTNDVSISGAGYVRKDKSSFESQRVVCLAGIVTTSDFTVVAAGSLRVTLGPATTGLQLPAMLKISLQSGERNRHWSDYLRTPINNGVAVFSNIAPGAFSFIIRNEDLPPIATNVVITGGSESRLSLPLPAFYSFAGRVTDRDGKPLEKIKILATPAAAQADASETDFADADRHESKRESTSDSKGVFKIKGLAAGRFRVSARHDDWLPTNRVVDISGNTDATAAPLVMLKGLHIAGTVTDAGGKPASGYQITLNNDFTSEMAMSGGQPPIFKHVEAANDGSFTFRGLLPGKYRLAVSDSDFNEITSLDNVAAGSDGIIITLAKKRIIKGTVVDAGGIPVPGASIQAAMASKRNEQRLYFSSRQSSAVTTDTNGCFELEAREGAAYDIQAGCPPLLPAKAAVDLSPGADYSGAPLKIVMARGHKISGTILAADGQPAAKGLKVSFSQGDEHPFMAGGEKHPAETDAQGNFKLEGVPPGIITLRVYEEPPEDAAIHNPKILSSSPVLVNTNATTLARIILPKMGSIRGTFTPGDGSKAGSVQVLLSALSGEGQLSFSAETDATGGFCFSNIPAGKYMAMAFDRGARAQPPAPELVEIPADRTVEITLGAKKSTGSAARLAGTASKDNTPFQAGDIHFMPVPKKTSSKADFLAMYSGSAQGKIGSNGAFSVKSLEPGEYLCIVLPRESGSSRVKARSNFQTIVQVVQGQTNLDISFAGVTLAGTVTGPGGQAVENARIAVTPSGANSMVKEMIARRSQTDTQGQYRVESLPPGKYDISAHHKEYAMANHTNVAISAPSNRADLVLSAGAMVTGKVTTLAGGSAMDALILLTSADNSHTSIGTAAEDGTYRTQPAVPQGDYKLYIALKGHALEVFQITLTGSTNCNVALVPGGNLSLTVTKQGKPVSGKTASIKSAEGAVLPRISGAGDPRSYYYCDFGLTVEATDENGHTLIRAIKPGKYSVSVSGENPSTPAEVKPMETAEIILEL